jgi:hypothetical protein
MIIDYIRKEGGLLSGDLAKYISETQNISETAARKRVERLKLPICKLTGLFSDNQSFVYHSEIYNKQIYFDKLLEAFKTKAKRCYAIITAINYHHGVILKSELPNYTFSPTTNIKGHQKFSTLIEKLIQINVLFEYDDYHYSLNSCLSNYDEPNIRHIKAVQFAKYFILDQFSNWSKNIGLSSYNTGELNKQVAGFQFAFGSPSYINGLVQYKEKRPNPGFVVADILIGNTTTIKEVDFFTQKIDAIKGSNKSIKLFPVLLLDWIDSNGFNKLKKTGVMIASIKEIFGDSYEQLIKDLINTITNAGAILKNSPEKYIELMEGLTKFITGKTNNLRGDLFELAVGYYYSKYSQSLDIGKNVPIKSKNKTREIDVLAIFEKEIKIVECKGYKNPIDQKDIEIYLSEKIPDIREWLLEIYPTKRYKFEIWCIGGYTPEATDLLQKAKTKTKKYDIDYFGQEDIIEKANDLDTNKFKKILNEYYIKESF